VQKSPKWAQYISIEPRPMQKMRSIHQNTNSMNTDTRWQQRFENFKKAFYQLKNAVILAGERDLSELEKQGVIQAFEFTHELAWKTLKDFLQNKGHQNIYGSKDTTRLAYNLGIITGGEQWMEMINSRNLSSHTYDEETADAIFEKIINIYFVEFENLLQTMNQLKDE
jgi:nucleotidyltransferase substrate binding protein (TIGR01987 family)